MAVTRTTTFNTNATGYVISNVACRVSCITVDSGGAGIGANSFVMLYDQTSAPTGGTDTPAFVEKVDTNQGFKNRYKIRFPGGGKRMGTGCGLMVATTFNGATGIGATGPTSIDVFFETGN